MKVVEAVTNFENKHDVSTWFERVASASNVADGLSRGCFFAHLEGIPRTDVSVNDVVTPLLGATRALGVGFRLTPFA